MSRCVVGDWHGQLDDEDRDALSRAVHVMTRASVFADICTAFGGRPFSLTALKDHLNGRCVCD